MQKKEDKDKSSESREGSAAHRLTRSSQVKSSTVKDPRREWSGEGEGRSVVIVCWVCNGAI